VAGTGSHALDLATGLLRVDTPALRRPGGSGSPPLRFHAQRICQQVAQSRPCNLPIPPLRPGLIDRDDEPVVRESLTEIRAHDRLLIPGKR
jgi:hypothetical protein